MSVTRSGQTVSADGCLTPAFPSAALHSTARPTTISPPRPPPGRFAPFRSTAGCRRRQAGDARRLARTAYRVGGGSECDRDSAECCFALFGGWHQGTARATMLARSSLRVWARALRHFCGTQWPLCPKSPPSPAPRSRGPTGDQVPAVSRHTHQAIRRPDSSNITAHCVPRKSARLSRALLSRPRARRGSARASLTGSLDAIRQHDAVQ